MHERDALMLIDTSGLLCLHHRAEPFHLLARTHYSNATRRVTHNYVLAEFVALATARRLPRVPAVSLVIDLVGNPDIEVTWVDPQLHSDATNLLMKRTDKHYSLCDAVSFLIMQRTGIQEALSTDRHFDQEGYRRLLV